MNVPVGPGGAPRRRRSDPAIGCRVAVIDAAVYVVVLIVVILNLAH